MSKFKSRIKCLGIESTAHTFGVSIVTGKGEILSDVRDMYKTKSGGIIPIKAAMHHKEVRDIILKQALEEAKLKINDVNLISVAIGPGLAPCLLSGLEFAKELSKKNKIPLIGVNHLCSHLEIGKLLTKAKNPVYILATGANTQIISLEGERYRIFGEALSIGLGNALDKFGRAINLGFPSGPKIEELAKKGKYIELPYVVKGMDVEFSGIVTSAINKHKKGAKKEDLCFSIQETCFSMLTEVSERALAHTNKNELLLIGGVAANKRLIEMLSIMCKERDAKFYVVPLKYSGDCGTQISWQGILQYKSNEAYYNKLKLEDIDIKPNWRIDQVKFNWL